MPSPIRLKKIADRILERAALTPGEIRIKTGGEWKSAYIGEGFLEVGYDNVVQIFSHLCEWPDAIDAVLAAMEEETVPARV